MDQAHALDYDQALVNEDRAFGDVVLAADLALPVPSCPDWSLLQLLRHVGRGDRWVAELSPNMPSPRWTPGACGNGRPPDNPDGARIWLHDGARLVVDAASATDPDLTVWTFLGPRPPRWWVRRRLHEATIHRADAAIAAGQPYRLGADPVDHLAGPNPTLTDGRRPTCPVL